MQINISDQLYQQLSDYALRAHMKIEGVVEEVLAKFLTPKPKKKSIFDNLDPHPNYILAKTDQELISTPTEWHHDFS